MVPNKPVLTIEEILNRYYYKEWVIDELREIGEKTTGTKSDLVQRYLDSDAIHRKDVFETVQSLLSSLRKQDLKQILRDHKLECAGNRNDLLERVFASFSFEPYIRRVNGYCNICDEKTDQELHFDNSWKASYRRCTVCNNDDPVKHYRLEFVEHLGSNSPNDSPITSNFKSNEVPDGIKYLKTNYWQIVATFVGVLALFGLKYGLIAGLIFSVILSISAALIGFILTEHRELNRLKTNDK